MSNYELLDKKPTSSFNLYVDDELKNLSYAKHDSTIMPFGSYLFRYQKYPGDIDLIEDIVGNSKQEVVKNFCKRIKEIVRSIQKKKGHYYSEVKFGQDLTYAIKVGYLKEGVYYVNPSLKQTLIKLYNNRQFSKEDYIRCMDILRGGNELHFDVFDEIIKIIRSYFIIRWTPAEILNNKKKLKSNKFITMEQALILSSLTKIDEIVYINGVFIEVTNIYHLQYKEHGQVEELNKNYISNVIPLEIERLFYSNMWYDPFKMLKRVVSYCNFMINETNNDHAAHYEIVKQLVPFLISNISLLNQQKGFLENLIKINEIKPNLPQIQNKGALDKIKDLLANIQEIDQTELIFLNKLLIKSMQKFNKLDIEKITEILQSKVNFHTIKFLNSIGWEHLPDIVLPNDYTITLDNPLSDLIDKQCKRSYVDTIVRNPIENPKKEFKKHINVLERIPSMPFMKGDIDKQNETTKQAAKDIIITQKEQEPKDEFETMSYDEPDEKIETLSYDKPNKIPQIDTSYWANELARYITPMVEPYLQPKQLPFYESYQDQYQTELNEQQDEIELQKMHKKLISNHLKEHPNMIEYDLTKTKHKPKLFEDNPYRDFYDDIEDRKLQERLYKLRNDPPSYESLYPPPSYQSIYPNAPPSYEYPSSHSSSYQSLSSTDEYKTGDPYNQDYENYLLNANPNYEYASKHNDYHNYNYDIPQAYGYDDAQNVKGLGRKRKVVRKPVKKYKKQYYNVIA